MAGGLAGTTDARSSKPRLRAPAAKAHYPGGASLGCRACSVFAVVILTGILQVLSGLALIGLVLMHSGRGGGLSDMFGGGLGSTAAGSTVVEKNLDRLTVIFSLIFAFTTLALALMLDGN